MKANNMDQCNYYSLPTETGMDGAFAIKEGQVTGDYLLNLDTEVET